MYDMYSILVIFFILCLCVFMPRVEELSFTDWENTWSTHIETTASISESVSQDVSQNLNKEHFDLFEKQSSYFAQCIKDDIDPYTKKPL